MAFFLAKCWCQYSILIFRDRTIMFLPDFCCSIPPFVWSANFPVQTLPNVSPLLLYAHDLQCCNNELWRRKGKEITQFFLQPFCLGCLGRQGTSHQYHWCYLVFVIWYWDKCGNLSGSECKKSIGQIKSLLGLQFHRKRQISPPSCMNIVAH